MFDPFGSEIYSDFYKETATDDLVFRYPVSHAPRFRRGFVFTTCMFTVQFCVTGTVAALWRWETRMREWKEMQGQDGPAEVEPLMLGIDGDPVRL